MQALVENQNVAIEIAGHGQTTGLPDWADLVRGRWR